MISVLHISDTHGQGETLCRVEDLALRHSGCEVVALTGDCTSKVTTQVPGEWDQWPQQLKLAVPGNHDLLHTFDLLPSWVTRTPWTSRLDDVIFLGIDSSIGLAEQLAQLRLEAEGNAGVVLLSHQWPDFESLTEELCRFLAGRKLVVLHGHEHPKAFSGSLWEEFVLVNGIGGYRSNVCSSVSRMRGIANLIIWESGQFECSEVQGHWT
ncbi:MAG TPA: metallophosphoesterase family protein [Pyrinomonadaceae bacterium]|nr:metallophosphoesterase family protein [Pyrinomonadaceae bacterium]